MINSKDTTKKSRPLKTVLFIGCIVGLFFILSSVKSMPDLVGKSSDIAMVELLNLFDNFDEHGEYILVEEYNDSIEKGVIIRTYPEAGEKISSTADITLYVSKGKEIVFPQITGGTLEDAISKLELFAQSKNMSLKVITDGYYSENSISPVELMKEIEYTLSEVETGEYTDNHLLKDNDFPILVIEEYSDTVPYNEVVSVEPNSLDAELITGATIKISLGTEEEAEFNFKENCTFVSYEDLLRYPVTYETTSIKLNCKIDKVEISKLLGIKYATVYWGILDGQTIIIHDTRVIQEPTLREGDSITVFGYGNNLDIIDKKQKAYQGSLLLGFSYNKTIDTYEVPSVNLKYVEFR